MDLNLKLEMKIRSTINQIHDNTNIKNLVFTTNLFNCIRGLYLVSDDNKIAIRVLDKPKGFNFKFISECKTRNYKYLEYIISDDINLLIYNLSNIKPTLKEFAEALNNDLPKSEVWFKNKFKKELIYNSLVIHYNKPIGKYIFDLYIPKYQVVIEVDGSYHDRNDQKERDAIKDELAKKSGLTCIRVKAYDDSSYDNFINQLTQRIHYIDTKRSNRKNPPKVNPAVILRKSQQ
jgi:very-short-patch-repair endonuclease